MFLIYFGFVVLLSGCGLQCVDCTPSLTPTNGNPVYVADRAASYDLSWNYNTDGATIERVSLLYIQGNVDIHVARKDPNPAALEINPASGYSNRITFSIGSGSVGRVTFRISNIVQSDSRAFKCQISFTTFDPAPVQSFTNLVVVVPPKITLKSQLPVTIDEGNTRTLLCVASGNPTPSITWTKGNTVVQQTSPSYTNTNYTITSATKDDAGTYTCTARVTAPGVSLSPDSYSFFVTVRYKPQVTSLTSNQTVDNGFDVSFTCQAEAVPTSITYSWFKDDGSQKLASNSDFVVNGRLLTVKQVKKSSAGRYSCSGTNDVGEGERRSTFLIVNYAPQTVTVTPNPPVDVELSGSTTLTCQADGHPAPTFSWKFNGKILNGARQNTLLLTNIEVKNAGTYTCIASNFRGSEETTRVVNVEYQPDVTNFTTGTPGNAVVQGTQVTLTCSANGYPAPTYLITGGNPVVSQGSPVVINSVQLSHEDSPYKCVPTNKEGSGPSKDLTIVVQVPPTFNPAQTLPTTKQTKNESDTMSYTCTAQAKPPAEFQWTLNGQNLTNGSLYSIAASIPAPSSKLFTTFGSLTINQLTWQQNGKFSCIAVNAAGNVTQNTELEVRYRPVVQTPADHPQNLTLAVGATATFNCKTIGNPPTTEHKWQFNGNDIPGEACSGCTSADTLRISSVTQQSAGWYSCIGSNSMGDGPPAKAQLLIKHKPSITGFPQSVYTVNETNNVTMVCRADGVPEPSISWTKTSSDKNVGFGEEFHIINTKSSDDGAYTCTATNELGSVSEGLTLHVQTRPTILTSTPITTNIPGATGEEVELTCIVSGKPTPTLSWKRDPKGNELSSQIDPKVKGITLQEKTIKMKVIVTKAGKEDGDKYYCFAVNLLGNDTQGYIIRERGAPDPPVDLKLVPFQVPKSQTVSVNVSWTPGYSGGFDQEFSIHYRRKGSGGDFTEESIGHPANNMHTVHQLSPNTQYEFMMQASNQRGKSEASAEAQVNTPDSAVPPDRGTVKATRMSDDLTVIVVTWTVTDEQVTKLSLEMREGDGGWSSVPGATDMSTSTTEFKVENLKADKKYTFRLDMRRPGEESTSYVESNTVLADPGIGARGDDKPLQNWMIAVIAGVAGVLLLAIVVLCLCCFKRRKKARGADQVNMSQTSSYVVGGPPDVNRSLDTRPRSYGMESVEDDPFIEAHFASMQSMNSTDGKKKKGDVGVNYGYLSQDSVQPQPEMLLNPGSRLSRNRPMAQSTGELDVNSAYPARGPQRDFNTLPPYHEPPSFEEAMRQSGRKPKTRKSTGDLAGPGQARHSGRRPRQMPADEPTDSSDGEIRYTPQRAAPPPPRVRHVEPIEDPGYAAVDQTGRVLAMEPRVLPQGPPAMSAPRNGPIDPTVPYAIPQKKKSSRKPRNEQSEPAIGPPPQYTPEDRLPEEPSHYPGDLDLDDPANLPRSERPPDLPPPMAMLPSNRGVNNYHEDPHDGLPEPPAFLRDVVYPQDGRDAAPYHPPPPSSSRQRQPYVNIHGQLVRPSSRESVELRRPDSLRSSRDELTPEPEMPPRQWQPRGSDSGDRAAPEINYVSYLV